MSKVPVPADNQHCNVFAGDHQHCTDATDGECICSCDGCTAAYDREHALNGAWPNPNQECGHCTDLATHASPMCADHANPSSIPWPVSSNASPHGTLWVTHDRRYGTRDSHHSEADARREAAREPAMIDVVEYESCGVRATSLKQP